MYQTLDGSGGDVLGIEITGGYTKADFETAKTDFEALLAKKERSFPAFEREYSHSMFFRPPVL